MRRLIFVLGMGRSGTSALTRVLSLCGASLPRCLLPPNCGNPTGYWEPFDGLNLNEEFLKQYGSNWYDPRLPQPGESALQMPKGRTFVDQIAKTLEDSAAERLFVIKEPRITALTEYWFAAARRVGFEIAVVIAVRHSEEVAASLAARDRVQKELSNSLWFKYNMLAEKKSRSVPRVFVEYPNLLADWRHEVDRIADALSIDLSSREDGEIDAFLSPDLRHQRASVGVGNELDLTTAQRVYAILSTASRDQGVPVSEIERLIVAQMTTGEARKAFDQFVNGFAPGGVRDPVSAPSCLEQ